MNIVKYAPKTYMDRVFDTDSFFNDFWPWASVEDRRSYGEDLKVNIVEDTDSYTLTAAVPGMKEKDIDLEIKDGRMTLKGQVEESQEKEQEHYRMKEFSRRSFERAFTIGEGIDQDKVSANLENGLLTVILPKKEEAKPKTVKVAIGS
jgi:HSP20 family protein